MALVVDPLYGERLRLLAAQMPVWIADTLVNRAVASLLWTEDAHVQITTFTVDPVASTAERCAAVLPSIVEHHGDHVQSPPLASIRVVGGELTEGLRAAFEQVGFRRFEWTPEGFEAIR